MQKPKPIAFELLAGESILMEKLPANVMILSQRMLKKRPKTSLIQ
jgi:hypothetical protein